MYKGIYKESEGGSEVQEEGCRHAGVREGIGKRGGRMETGGREESMGIEKEVRKKEKVRVKKEARDSEREGMEKTFMYSVHVHVHVCAYPKGLGLL